MNTIIYKKESYDIIGAAMKVYNFLGHGYLEGVYQEALEIELKRAGIPTEREKELQIIYDGIVLSQKFKTDFVCYDKLIIELKAVSALNDAHRSQLFNYLHATKMRLGLLINFCNPNGLEWERKVL